MNCRYSNCKYSNDSNIYTQQQISSSPHVSLSTTREWYITTLLWWFSGTCDYYCSTIKGGTNYYLLPWMCTVISGHTIAFASTLIIVFKTVVTIYNDSLYSDYYLYKCIIIGNKNTIILYKLCFQLKKNLVYELTRHWLFYNYSSLTRFCY